MADSQEILNDVLMHYGTKGQKWGERNYQNPDGTYTELGKARRRIGSTEFGTKAYKDMTRRERKEAQKKARHNEKERKEQREFNKEKKRAMEDADLEFVTKHINKFTNEELNAVVDRYKRMQVVKDLNNQNKKDTDYYIDKALKYLDKASKVSKYVTDIANNINDAQTKSINKKKAQEELNKLQNPEKKEQTAAQKYVEEQQKYKMEQEKEKAEREKLTTAEKRREEEADALNHLKMLSNEAKQQKADAEAEMQKIKDTEMADRKAKQDAYDAWKAERDARNKELDNLDKQIKKQQDDEAAKRLEEKNKKYFKDQEDTEAWAKWLVNENKKQNDANDYWNKVAEDKKQKKVEENQQYWKRYTDEDFTDRFGSTKSKSSINPPSKVSKERFEQLDSTTQKYLSRINKATVQARIGDVRDDKWKKEIRKGKADIDKWVKDMKKKYMKERNMSSKEAEEKAEAYVDAWLDAYDDGRITGI